MAARYFQEKGDRNFGTADVAAALDLLPFAAALVDRNGTVVAANEAWRARPHGACPGDSWPAWCRAHFSGEDGERLAKVSERVLRDGESAAVDDFGRPEWRQRVTVSRVAEAFLVTLQEFPHTAEPARDPQSQKMETMGRLVSGVAHDFANLLTVIEGYSQLLLGRVAANDPLRPELNEIHRAASRGARLTGHLLGYTRGQRPDPRPLDLNVLVADTERMLRPFLGEHVEVRMVLGPGIGDVVADAGQMEQVVMNLLLNARDAMPSGGTISVETRNVDLDPETANAHGLAPGAAVMLVIQDTGNGILPEAMGRIFEPFFTTKLEGKGAGIGLSTVRSIISERGGQIWVNSQLGRGSEFIICLPRSGDGAKPGERAPEPPQVSGGAETVLLVEDDQCVRKLLRRVLERRGYRIVEAPDGEAAFRMFEERSGEIDLVLTDMVMPRMNGRELAERIRTIHPDLKILFMSGHTEDVLVNTGALDPGMKLLTKPLRPEALAASVREALDSPVLPFNRL
jgi:signal transduction histidine kinase